MRDEHSLVDTYPEAIRRLWLLFLSWSTLASKRGSATVYQIVAHKGTRKYGRHGTQYTDKTRCQGTKNATHRPQRK